MIIFIHKRVGREKFAEFIFGAKKNEERRRQAGRVRMKRDRFIKSLLSIAFMIEI